MKVINVIALILVIVSALNQGMIGFFGMDVLGSLFGPYMYIFMAIVGLAGLWSLRFFKACCCCHCCCCGKDKKKGDKGGSCCR